MGQWYDVKARLRWIAYIGWKDYAVRITVRSFSEMYPSFQSVLPDLGLG